MKYYEIIAELSSLFNEIELSEGEVSEEQLNRLESLEIASNEKIQQLIWIHSQRKQEIAGIKDRKKTLDAMQKSKEKQIEFLEKVLAQLTQNNKWTNGVETISYRKSEQVIVEDLESLPTQYLRKKEIVEADKTALKEALKNGEEIKGAILQENFNIQVK